MPPRSIAPRLFSRKRPHIATSPPSHPQPYPYSHSYSHATPSPKPIDIQDLKSRPPKVIRDYLVPMPSHLLTTTLDDLLLPRTPPASSSSLSPASTTSQQHLPQGHHLVYFPLQTPASQLAPDGADRDHAPNEEFTKRLWAGGEVRFHHHHHRRNLVLDGRPWVCREEIGDVRVKGEEKKPGSEKVFVDVWRRYALGHDPNPEEWDIEERRTLVFMRKTGDDVSQEAPKGRLVKYAHAPTYSASLIPTPAHLFHFSALTYNAHAIHVDPQYARSQDGHRALLVHGPLTLALMLRVLNDHHHHHSSSKRLSAAAAGQDGAAASSLTGGGGVVKSIVYRNYAPLYVGEEMKVCVKPAKRGAASGVQDDEEEEEWDVWVEGPEGGLAVKGSVVVDAKRAKSS